MIQTLPITKVREELANLVNNAKKQLNEYIITVNGSPAAVIVSATEYESWKETNEILADKSLMEAIKKGEEESVLGRLYDWEDVKKELGNYILHDVSNTTYGSSKKRAKRNKKKILRRD